MLDKEYKNDQKEDDFEYDIDKKSSFSKLGYIKLLALVAVFLIAVFISLFYVLGYNKSNEKPKEHIIISSDLVLEKPSSKEDFAYSFDNKIFHEKIKKDNFISSKLTNKTSSIFLQRSRSQNKSFIYSHDIRAIIKDANSYMHSNLAKKYHDKKHSQNKQKPQDKAQKQALDSKKHILKDKPKIAIIIDDISSSKELRLVKSINLDITPSIFPKTKLWKNTPKLAKNLPFFMVHLPLEAKSYTNKDTKWIKKGASKEYINTYIKQIKTDFPNVGFINNHTGSLFTQSKKDMTNLLSILKKYDITFVDSVTTNHSYIEKLQRQKNKLFLRRDVFLDNSKNVAYIKRQLRSLFYHANKNGYAIAIGHPSTKTIKAIKSYEGVLKEKYDVIYINKMYDYLNNQKITLYGTKIKNTN